jgi:hypothetical protein
MTQRTPQNLRVIHGNSPGGNIIRYPHRSLFTHDRTNGFHCLGDAQEFRVDNQIIIQRIGDRGNGFRAVFTVPQEETVIFLTPHISIRLNTGNMGINLIKRRIKSRPAPEPQRGGADKIIIFTNNY